MDDRYVPFNVPILQTIAAKSTGRQRCVSIMKFAEGGFNRVFLLRMDDGFEVIAKIPYRITVPPRHLTASEVATMEFLRQHVNIPVPRVYTWSSDKSNPVGAEYIIMEKVNGVVLGDIWWSLSGKERLTVITQLVQCETKMFQSPLRSYGSLYFNGSLPQDMTHPLNGRDYGDAASSSWCIGPVANMAFWHDGRENLKVDHGPCKRLLSRIRTHENSRAISKRIHALYQRAGAHVGLGVCQTTPKRILLLPIRTCHPSK